MRCKTDGWLENSECVKNCDCHLDPRNMKAGPLINLKPHLMPPDIPLGEPRRAFEDTFSAMTVIKERFFPHLLTDKERPYIEGAITDAYSNGFRNNPDKV